jgi:thioredoxin reductase
MPDVIVVGAGPAGLSAALTLGRQRRNVLVLDSGEPRNAPADGVHMLLSRDGVPPAELRRLGREDLAAYPTVEYREAVAVTAARTVGGFDVTLSGGTAEHARSLILATGIADELPPLPGVAERFGKSVFHCPFCHGFEARDQPLAVLGNDFVHAVLALYLADRLTGDVILCTGGPQSLGAELTAKLAERGVGIREDELAAVDGDFGRLKVVFAGGEVLERGAVFLHPGARQKSPLAARLGCGTLPDGTVRVDERQLSTVPGVFAVGDMARLASAPGPMPFAVTGAADGVRAAIWADQALLMSGLGLTRPGRG